MNLNPAIAAKNFAHLISGRGTVSAKKAKEEDEDEEEEGEENEGKEKGKKKGEDKKPPADDKEDGKDAKKDGKKCEDDEDKKDKKMSEEEKDKEEEEEEEDKEDRKDQGKKKSKAEGFDAATIARCEAIFSSEHAAGRPAEAATLAFRSKLSADEAIALLASFGPIPKGARLADRMSSVKIPDVGASAPKGGSADPATAMAASIIGCYNKANNE